MKIVIANSKTWFDISMLSRHPYFTKVGVSEVTDPSELEQIAFQEVDFIFFVHWNWRVPARILEETQCINFHTSPLPYGRGGSPLQNLIRDGFQSAPVNAILMTEEIDAGPIYCSQNISLLNSLEKILERISSAIISLMVQILEGKFELTQQRGAVHVYKRLKHSDNQLKSEYSLEQLYDEIRMVDGSDYQKAFIPFGKYDLVFQKAEYADSTLTAVVKFLNRNDKT